MTLDTLQDRCRIGVMVSADPVTDIGGPTCVRRSFDHKIQFAGSTPTGNQSDRAPELSPIFSSGVTALPLICNVLIVLVPPTSSI